MRAILIKANNQKRVLLVLSIYQFLTPSSTKSFTKILLAMAIAAPPRPERTDIVFGLSIVYGGIIKRHNPLINVTIHKMILE